MSWFKRGYDAGEDVLGKSVEWAHTHANARTVHGCPDCGEKMYVRIRGRDGVPFLGCGGFPECKYGASPWGFYKRALHDVDPDCDPTEKPDERESHDDWEQDFFHSLFDFYQGD